jgi:hypothetical protein
MTNDFLVAICRLGLVAATSAAALVTHVPATTNAQGVGGVVRSATTVVAGATVRLTPVGGDSTRYVTTVTDAEGRFQFARLARGLWYAEARMIGYQPLRTRVEVADSATFVQLTLTAIQPTLDTVAVSAARSRADSYGPNSRMQVFLDRQALGRGRFFDRDAIEASGRTTLADLLRTIGGAKVSRRIDGSVDVMFARCLGQGVPSAMRQQPATTQLFINGTVIKDAAAEIGLLRLSDIEAIEIYRGPSELPAEAVGNGCSAIFVWTRYGT